MQQTKRRYRTGRAMGGMVIGIRKKLVVKREGMEKEKEGMMLGGVMLGGNIGR